MLRGRKFDYKVLLEELFCPCISQRESSWDAINEHFFVNLLLILSLTHRSLHWNLKLWFILFRIPVPPMEENLVRRIKIDRNTRRFIFLEFNGCTENGLLEKRSTILGEYSFFVMMTRVLLLLCKNRVMRQDCIFIHHYQYITEFSFQRFSNSDD